MQSIRDNYAISVKRGSLTQAEMDKRLPLIEPVGTYEEIADCDAVIEAVFEQIPVKQEVFRQLDAHMKPGALLFTNTSAHRHRQDRRRDEAARGGGRHALLRARPT